MTTTTTATTCAGPFAGFASCSPASSARAATRSPGCAPDDRDQQRLLDDLRALSDTRSDFATACASRRSGR
jgi:hypothetical protein